MKPQFSEFSYGYAITEELVQKLGYLIVGSPIFPSLQDEGKKGGGYDLKLPTSGKPIYIQFKISHYMIGLNAKEHSLFSSSYYRMHLYASKHSNQHMMLQELEKRGEYVICIAPEFHTVAELNRNYIARTNINNSSAFSPIDINLPDDGEHYIAFDRKLNHGYLCSDEPKEIEILSLKNGIRGLLDKKKADSMRIDDSFIGNRLDIVIDIIKSLYGTDIHLPRQAHPSSAYLGYLLRTFFDAQLVIIPDGV